MLKPEHLKVGQRVRCVHVGDHDRTGKTGRIMKDGYIDIEWDDGVYRNRSWGERSSFDPIEDEKPTPPPSPVAKAPAPIGAPVPLDVCKKHYYGIEEPCTCKVKR